MLYLIYILNMYITVKTISIYIFMWYAMLTLGNLNDSFHMQNTVFVGFYEYNTFVPYILFEIP